MKIILAGPYPKGTVAMFQKLLPEDEFLCVEDQESYDQLIAGELVIVRVLKTTEQTMANKKDLKGIIRWGAGYDSVDTEAARANGIMVAVTPGANAYAVSELAVTLMLTLGRKIVEHNHRTHNGLWNNKLFVNEMTTLNRKTVGIIGGGNIGQSVAKKVQAFGANVVYFDAKRLPQEVEEKNQMEYVSLDDLLARSDVVTLHVPLLESTKYMIGEKQLARMKSHSLLINTARGGVADDRAIAEALKNGQLGGAGLDCVEDENLAQELFGDMENVIMTPHIGGTTNDLPSEMVPRIAAQIERYRNSKTMDYIVN